MGNTEIIVDFRDFDHSNRGCPPAYNIAVHVMNLCTVRADLVEISGSHSRSCAYAQDYVIPTLAQDLRIFTDNSFLQSVSKSRYSIGYCQFLEVSILDACTVYTCLTQ